DKLDAVLEDLNTPKAQVIEKTNPAQFVQGLLKPRELQAASSLQLGRSLKTIFEPGKDAPAQLLVNFEPVLKDTFYKAWANASLSSTPRDLKAVYVLRMQAPLFGANVTEPPTYYVEDIPNPNSSNNGPLPPLHVKGELKTQ